MIPGFDASAGYGNDEYEEGQYEGLGGDITEEELIKMAMEQSMKTHKEESEKNGSNNQP